MEWRPGRAGPGPGNGGAGREPTCSSREASLCSTEPDRFRLSISSRSTTVLTLKDHLAEPSGAGLGGRMPGNAEPVCRCESPPDPLTSGTFPETGSIYNTRPYRTNSAPAPKGKIVQQADAPAHTATLPARGSPGLTLICQQAARRPRAKFKAASGCSWVWGRGSAAVGGPFVGVCLISLQHGGFHPTLAAKCQVYRQRIPRPNAAQTLLPGCAWRFLLSPLKGRPQRTLLGTKSAATTSEC